MLCFQGNGLKAISKVLQLIKRLLLLPRIGGLLLQWLHKKNKGYSNGSLDALGLPMGFVLPILLGSLATIAFLSLCVFTSCPQNGKPNAGFDCACHINYAAAFYFSPFNRKFAFIFGETNFRKFATF